MYIFKQPGIGGEVGCHQDATFLYTDPITVVGFWFAIEDATLENGCLWAAPGGHRAPLRKVFKRAGGSDEGGTLFEELDSSPLPTPPTIWCPSRYRRHTRAARWQAPPLERRQPLRPVRHAYSVHCISAAAEYPEWNWLQRPAGMPLRRLDRNDAASSVR